MTHVPPSDWLISVDDHVIEPPNVWLDRLSSKYHDRAPRMARGDRGAVWIPYFLERAEQVLDKQRHWAVSGAMKSYTSSFGFEESAAIREADVMTLDVRATFRDHIYGCFIDDVAGIQCLDLIGEDNVMAETDYPHTDTTWPNSIDVLNKLIGHLPPATQHKLRRANAETLFRFTPIEPSIDASVR